MTKEEIEEFTETLREIKSLLGLYGSGFIAMFESRYKDAIRDWHEEKMRRRRSRGS